MKIDWKRKLTSRKFWSAIIGFVSQIMLASGATEGTITQTAAVIMAGATLIAYMLVEGFADGANAATDQVLPGEIGFELKHNEDDSRITEGILL